MAGSAPRISLALLLLRSEQALSAPMRVIIAMHSGSPAQFVSLLVLPFYSRRDLSALGWHCPCQSPSRRPRKLKVRSSVGLDGYRRERLSEGQVCRMLGFREMRRDAG